MKIESDDSVKLTMTRGEYEVLQHSLKCLVNQTTPENWFPIVELKNALIKYG